jgi:alkanesulfonate monooxygenase SsuD/methylene tetrahydromethanopterin reductase-like flavin-dependent oxidoreductase (luciferase family)
LRYDVFFSISHTPVEGRLPSEAEMWRAFFEEVAAADALGFEVAWVAESHLSSEVQKRGPEPVIPHWQGEVGLNVDILQLAHQVHKRTRRIEVGSAVMNLLCMGGPIAHAERVAAFCALHGADPAESRRLHLGFGAGRFDFMNRACGIVPRDAVEKAAGQVLKHKTFEEATEVFLRLLRGDELASSDLAPRALHRSDFRSEQAWRAVQDAARSQDELIPLRPRWEFERLKIVPQAWRRELLELMIGSHDPALQIAANRILPVKVFNLSITQPAVIEATHQRMREAYHPAGGPWHRDHMPRTVFVFLNHEPGLGPAECRSHAEREARAALGAYWTALEGTLDPTKVEGAADNALIGNAEDLAEQMVARFDPDDRLMLWFDFFNHDVGRVIRNLQAFVREVAPRVAERLARQGQAE